MNIRWTETLGGFGTDIIAIIIGILFLTTKYTGWTILYFMTILLDFYLAFRTICTMINHLKPREKTDILTLMINIAFPIYLIFYPDHFASTSFVLYGLWMLAHGIIWMISFYVKREDRLSGAPSFFFASVISTILAFFLLFTNKTADKTALISLLLGLYFIIYGLLGFAFHMLTRPSATKEQRRNWSFTLPVFFTFLLPLSAYVDVTKLIRDSKGETDQPSIPTDLHVYVYLKGHGPEILGHLDIAYKGTVYSYGCHDPLHRKLAGTLGDGVLFVADEDLFLKEHLGTEQKTIICYGINLNEAEHRLIEKRISDMMARTIPWQSKAEQCDKAQIPFEGFVDYASRVYNETHCRMYKFREGRFRTYFVTYTNCVMLADELIRNKDLNIVDLSGIVTPGAYLSFLNTEYAKKNSIVVSRTIYAPFPRSSAESNQ